MLLQICTSQLDMDSHINFPEARDISSSPYRGFKIQFLIPTRLAVILKLEAFSIFYIQSKNKLCEKANHSVSQHNYHYPMVYAVLSEAPWTAVIQLPLW